MGSLMTLFCPPKQKRVVVLGLDNAGKTTLVYCLHQSLVLFHRPNAAPDVTKHTVPHHNLLVTFYIVGSHPHQLQRDHCMFAYGLVFVIDASDKRRLKEAEECFVQVVKSGNNRKDIPLLILANKQDKVTIQTSTIRDLLSIQTLPGHVQLMECSAFEKGSIEESFDWLFEKL